MHQRGSGQLIGLVMGLVACSNATWEAPTAESQLSLTASYVATADVAIVKQFPNTNFGGVATCGASGYQSSLGRSCLIRFNLPQRLNITVNSAWIDLRVTDISLQPFTVYQVATDWVESDATWNQFRAGFPWQIPGALGPGDRGPNLGEFTFHQVDSIISLHPLNGGVEMVQSWFANPLSNHGVIVTDDLNDDRVVFATREHATPEYRPTLHVDYTVNQGTGGTTPMGGGGGSSGTSPAGFGGRSP